MRKLNKLIKEFVESSPIIDYSKIETIDQEIFEIDFEENRDISTLSIHFDVEDIHESSFTWMTETQMKNGKIERYKDESYICDYILFDAVFSPREVRVVLNDISHLFGKLSARLHDSIQILKLLNKNLSEKARKVVLKEEKKFEQREIAYEVREMKDVEKYMKKLGRK
jgi:hypothetical protein